MFEGLVGLVDPQDGVRKHATPLAFSISKFDMHDEQHLRTRTGLHLDSNIQHSQRIAILNNTYSGVKSRMADYHACISARDAGDIESVAILFREAARNVL